MHTTRIQVRLAETDQNGVVYYSQYFVYFDVAKTRFLRRMGLDPIGLGEPGQKLLAAEAGCTFHAPARFEDLVNVSSWVRKTGNSSVVFDFEVSRGETLLAEGYLVNVLVGGDGKPVRLPQDARLRLIRYVKKQS